MNGRPGRSPWAAGIALAGLLFVGALVATLVFGIRSASRVSDPAYYARGVHHGQRVQEALAARSLGWQVEASFAGGHLEVRLRDADNALVGGAQVQLVQLTAEGLPGPAVSLGEASPGTYRTELSLPPGPVSALLELHAEGATMTRPVLLVP